MLEIVLLNIALMFSVSGQLPSGSQILFADTNNTTAVADNLDYEVATGLEVGKQNQFKGWAWVERERDVYYTGLDLAGRIRVDSCFLPHEWKAFFKNRQAQGILQGGIGTSAIVLKYGRIGSGVVWDHSNPAATLNFGLKTTAVRVGMAIYRNNGPEVESAFASIVAPLWPLKYAAPYFELKYAFDRNRNETLRAKIGVKIHNAKE